MMGRMYCLTALLVVVGMCVTGSAAQDRCAKNANGCSIPFNADYFYKKLFTPACNRHDHCYSCGVKFGRNRSSCDQGFLRDMRAACGNRPYCRNFAQQYYNSVRLFGNSHYRRQADGYCSANWVSSCIPSA